MGTEVFAENEQAAEENLLPFLFWLQPDSTVVGGEDLISGLFFLSSKH